MALPNFHFDDKDIELLQSSWATQINPVILNPLVLGRTIKNAQLQIGANVLNHGLGRNLQGWFIVRQRGPAALYDTQDSNTMPNLTLNLTSDAAVNVDVYVY